MIIAGCCTVMMQTIHTNGNHMPNSFKFFSLELVLIAVLSGTVPRLKANIFHMCYSEKYFC